MDIIEEVQRQINKCSKCGTCRAYCPVFEVIPHEPFAARGKVQLARRYLEGALPPSERFREIFSQCLLCKTCVAACPNGVEADLVVGSVKARLSEEQGLSLIKRWGLRYLLPSNRRLEYLARAIRFCKRTGLCRLARPLAGLFPGRVGQLEELLPLPAPRALRSLFPRRILPSGAPRGKVAYFTGCMTNLVFTAVGRAVIKILTRLGLEVHLPEQVCCGLPALAQGDLATFRRLAVKNIASFSQENYEAIIVDCASCGSTWREYGRWTGLAQARDLGGLVVDISQYLVEQVGLEQVKLCLSGGPSAKHTVVTYHDPCHLKKGLQIYAAPRKILGVLPGMEFREMEGADRCCGAAGSYCFLHYDVAQKIGQRKIEAIAATGASVVATECPACIMQIAHALRRSGQDTAVLHVAELLAGSMN
ncbi:(Fe-S)-binding protein [Moorellaceae bacterium AZ2]